MSDKKYRKKPVEVEAVQWTRNDAPSKLIDFTNSLVQINDVEEVFKVYDRLHNEWIPFYWNDWIIKGVQGEFYPCRPDVFDATYEVPPNDETEADEHHSVQELYDYRMAYNALTFNQWARDGKYEVHKSWRHGDGEKCFGGGWFIVSAATPYGQVTNHYSSEHWYLFHVPIRERAAEWDGHTPQQALERLIRLAEVQND